MPDDRSDPTTDGRLRRISMLGTLPPLLGISPYCAALAEALSENVQVEFLSFHRQYPKWLYPGKSIEDPTAFPPSHTNLTIHRRLAWYNPIGWITEGLRLRGELLHVQWWSLPLGPVMLVVAVIARLRKIPRVITVHNVQAHERNVLYRWLTSALLALADRIIVHSEQQANELRDIYGIDGTAIQVIPHGTLQTPSPVDKDDGTILRRLQLTPDTRVLLQFGAIRPYKGVDTALKAMASVVASHPKAVLLVVGALRMEADEFEMLINKHHLRDHVRMVLDYVPERDVSAYFSISELVLLPYKHFSSQSGAGLLALSMGLPLVVSRVGALPELVKDDRFIVPPDDPAALAHAVDTILGDTDLRHRLAGETKTQAALFGWTAIAAATTSLYESLLRES